MCGPHPPAERFLRCNEPTPKRSELPCFHHDAKMSWSLDIAKFSSHVTQSLVTPESERSTSIHFPAAGLDTDTYYQFKFLHSYLKMASEHQLARARSSGRKALDYVYLGFFAFHLVVIFGACLLCPYFRSPAPRSSPRRANLIGNWEQNT
jgi:hypothetical protein